MKPACESKCKLLRTAMELIEESSYGAVSVDDICKKAGVNKGSFYHFFPSKSDLTVAAMEADWQEKLPVYDTLFSPQFPPLERLERYCDFVREGQVAKQARYGKILGCPMITLGAELSTRDEKIREKTREIGHRYVTYLESIVRDAKHEGLTSVPDCREAALQLFAYFQGVLLQAKIQNDVAPLATLKDGMFHLLRLDLAAA